MDNILLYPMGISDSCHYASIFLSEAGIALADHPSPDITHLLLDIPGSRLLREGCTLENLLPMLPETVTVIGGNLSFACLNGYQKNDLLKEPFFLAKNASITAECALQAAAPYLETTFADASVLILGWGRIGKCLARILSDLGAAVTVAARKADDRAMLSALGYHAIDFPQIPETLRSTTILFNTVPELPLHKDLLDSWENGIAVDLASSPGMPGKNVIAARGLPGKFAPKSAGKLIAETILRLRKEELL